MMASNPSVQPQRNRRRRPRSRLGTTMDSQAVRTVSMETCVRPQAAGGRSIELFTSESIDVRTLSSSTNCKIGMVLPLKESVRPQCTKRCFFGFIISARHWQKRTREEPQITSLSKTIYLFVPSARTPYSYSTMTTIRTTQSFFAEASCRFVSIFTCASEKCKSREMRERESISDDVAQDVIASVYFYFVDR